MNRSLDLPLLINTGSIWCVSSNAPPLRYENIHVWRCNINEAETRLTDLAAVLSDDERDKANRFRFEKDCRRYIAVRGILRFLLSRYIGMSPNAIDFSYGRYGKPFLADNRKSLDFNISHSGDLALFAVTCNRSVGIDVERVRGEIVTNELAEQFFAPGELSQFVKQSGEQKIPAFFNCWTRKESFIKAVGMGLTLPLREITIPIETEIAARRIQINNPHLSDSHWSVRSLTIDKSNEYAAAVTAAGNNWSLNL